MPSSSWETLVGDRLEQPPQADIITFTNDPRADGLRLHSRNPETETLRQWEGLALAKGQTVFFVGAGLGYLVEKALRFECRVIWVESNALILAAALNRCDYTQYKDQLHILIPPLSRDTLDTLLSGSAVEELAVYVHRPTATALKGSYTLIEQWTLRRSVNQATMARFDREWARNLILNWSILEEARPVARLFSRYPGQTALICAAGPSLSDDLPVIAAHRQRFFLIAVDTALSVVCAAGMDPDLVVTVDPQLVNSYYLEGYNGKAIFVADPATCNRSLRLLDTGRLFFFSSPLPLGRFFESFLREEAGQVAYGGSVTTNAYDLALKMGFATVVFSGLDLSFPDTRVHARGAMLEERLNLKEERLFRREMHNRMQRRALPERQLPGQNGTQPTNDKMIVFYNWFTHRFALDQKQARLVSSQTSALLMRGLESVPLNDFLSGLPEVQKDSPPLPGPGLHRARLHRRLKELQLEFDSLADLLGSALDLLEKTKKITPELTAELDRVDAKLQESRESLQLLGAATQEAIMQSQNRMSGPDQALEQTKKLYRALLGSARSHHRWLSIYLKLSLRSETEQQ